MSPPIFTIPRLSHGNNEENEMMQPTRTELLEAWMTLYKIPAGRDYDFFSQEEWSSIYTVLGLIDKLQREVENAAE